MRRKRDQMIRLVLGDGEVAALVSQTRSGLLQMQRDRIMHLGFNAAADQESQQLIAALKTRHVELLRLHVTGQAFGYGYEFGQLAQPLIQLACISIAQLHQIRYRVQYSAAYDGLKGLQAHVDAPKIDVIAVR